MTSEPAAVPGRRGLRRLGDWTARINARTLRADLLAGLLGWFGWRRFHRSRRT